MPSNRLTITLDHDGPTVALDSFLTVIMEAVSLLRGVDCIKANTPHPNTRWEISAVSMHSPIQCTLEGVGLKADGPFVEIVDSFLLDVKRLEDGGKPEFFTPDMQDSAKRLVSVLGHRGVRGMRFNSDSLEAKPTLRVAARVEELADRYFEIGSIEGKLDVINVHGQRDSIKVYDARYGTAVVCRVSDTQLEEAKALLRKRVKVSGRIRCEHKRPKEVTDVFSIQPLGDSTALPQLEDIGPVDLTGGQEPADYLRGGGEDE
ncbi:MAG: hypothetical protein IMZ62_09845 [Chloroflexi bacterium]|nr:hypothetical protein [Chloroflexota bacterium]